MHPILLQFQEIMQRSYPDWVWQLKPKPIRDHVPVFTFHTVQPDTFEAQLQFLSQNGYQTITSDAYYEFVMTGKQFWDRAVMLTFDDGRKSVWSVAYPLLKKYNMKATIFLSPAIMDSSDTISPMLAEGRNRHIDQKYILNCDRSAAPTLTWKEIRIMHQDRVIDFQCHSYSHQRIPIDNTIQGYVTPEFKQDHYFKFGIPFSEGEPSDPFDSLGAPVYRSAPFLSGIPMFKENQALRSECIAYVKNKGIEFFKQSDWKQELESIVKKYSSRQSVAEYESESEQTDRIMSELSTAQKVIESHLSGHQVRHLAYPWGTGSDISVTCSRQVGYLSNFWSTLPRLNQNRQGSDPFHLVRLKHDFIWRLPGIHRQSLLQLFLLKSKRRVQGAIDY